MLSSKFCISTLTILANLGCAGEIPHARVPEETALSSPLGPSYVLVPLPGDDTSLLGRVLPVAPEPGRALEELAMPNPCLDKLEPESAAASLNQFEDATELGVGARARAMLSSFGFSADFQQATHFVYRLNTERRLARVDTVEYTQCCQERGCGFGYVSALVYGDGEYVSAKETVGSASVDFAVSNASGRVALKAIHRRHVRGWVAAVIRPTDPNQTASIGPLGRGSIVGITPDSLPSQVKAIYEAGKITVGHPQPGQYAFSVSGNWITEREFARRYRGVVRSDELAALDSARVSTAGVVLTGIGLALAGTATYLVVAPTRCGNGTGNGSGDSCHFSDTGEYDAGGTYRDQTKLVVGGLLYLPAAGFLEEPRTLSGAEAGPREMT